MTKATNARCPRWIVFAKVSCIRQCPHAKCAVLARGLAARGTFHAWGCRERRGQLMLREFVMRRLQFGVDGHKEARSNSCRSAAFSKYQLAVVQAGHPREILQRRRRTSKRVRLRFFRQTWGFVLSSQVQALQILACRTAALCRQQTIRAARPFHFTFCSRIGYIVNLVCLSSLRLTTLCSSANACLDPDGTDLGRSSKAVF